MVEDVVSHLCVFAALLVPEYQVDPTVEVPRHVVRLHGLAELADKVFRRLGPWRQDDVTDRGAAVPDPEVDAS